MMLLACLFVRHVLSLVLHTGTPTNLRLRSTSGTSRRHDQKDSPVSRPGVNSAVPWHQDGGANVRTVWIALDPVSPSSGGLRVLRGGHKMGRMPYAPVKSVDDLEAAAYFAQNNVFRVDHENFDMENVYEYRFPAGGLDNRE